MKAKIKENKSLLMLIFLGIFSFSTGLFSNYRELWLDSNGLSTLSISKIITFSSVVTTMALLFFSLKVSTKKLKNGVLVSIIMKMIASTVLLCLNNTQYTFWIKFFMFFNIAFDEIILSSVYPLILSIKKSDEIYTKREVVESITGKLGFFIVSFLLGRTFGNFTIDYNKCLLLSIIFSFLSFVALLNIDIEGKEAKTVSLKETLKYLNYNKNLYLYLFVSFSGSIAWASILGLKMLTLTDIIGLSTKMASYLILTLGIITNILAILIVKYLKFKNDYINIFFKYGFRVILYFLVFFTNSKTILLITIVYLLLSDMTYSFVFNGYFINNMEEKYTLIFNVLKYSVSLFGNGIGAYICGLTFNLSIRYIGLATGVVGLITYVSSNMLVKEKQKMIARQEQIF